jgi:hypothetical protein
MPQKLYESDFLTVNLSNILNRQVTTNKTKPATNVKSNAQMPSKVPDLKQITDWGKELKRRINANNSLSAEAREKEYDIESKFFEDYFNNANPKWDAVCAKQLMAMGEALRKALKVLGFDRTVNPILSFISDDYVISELIKPRLLNINTFKAIYNTVAKKLVANSQMFESNNYNIIYCKDLYKKPATEMLEYIALQSAILEVAADAYPADLQKINNMVFIHEDGVAEKEPAKRAAIIKSNFDKLTTNGVKLGKLNSLKTAELIYKALSSIEVMDEDALRALVAQLKTAADKLAALQYLSFNTNSAAARSGMSNANLQAVPVNDLVKSTRAVAKLMSNKKITATNADAIAGLILSGLKA